MNIINYYKKKLAVQIAPYDKSYFENSFTDKQRNIIIFLSCDYGNLGDYAITKAQVKYLKKIYPKSNIIYVGANIEVAVYRYIRKKT